MERFSAKDAKAATEQAIAKKQQSYQNKVNEQYQSVIAAIKRESNAGNNTLDYRHDLRPEAIKILKEDGYKVRDNGMNVASVYEITW